MAENGIPRELTPRQKALIDLMATYPFPSLREAAEALRIPHNTAMKWPGKPGFKAALGAAYEAGKSETAADLEIRIHALKQRATEALEHGLTGELPASAIRASEIVLDRILGKPKERREISGKDGGALNVTISFDRAQGDAE